MASILHRFLMCWANFLSLTNTQFRQKHHNYLKEQSFLATVITRKISFYQALPRILWIVFPPFFLLYKNSRKWPVYDTLLFQMHF